TSIKCYNCSSNKDIECSEQFDSENNSLKPVNCDIYEGEYCIKTTGIFEGEMGTKRFCSSRDLGNYCEYVRRSGDDREYRSCIYTCSSDECNSSINLKFNNFLIILLCVTCFISFKNAKL
ncbi:uncharacterized protein B4U80_01229, partial [Leptotrombidium deliense]